jgi:hypothetical protein
MERALATRSATILAFALTVVSQNVNSVAARNVDMPGTRAASPSAALPASEFRAEEPILWPSEAGVDFMPLVIPFNDYNNCATGFGFRNTARSSIGKSFVSFLGVPFVVDAGINPRALTIGQPVFYCTLTPVNPGVIPVNARGSRLWLLANADNNAPFPNTLFETTIYYADGANRDGEVQEAHTGLQGFIEFASWGYQSRPDLAVYQDDCYDPECCSGHGYVYVFFVELDSQREVAEVRIAAPPTINSAYIYSATLAR